MKPISATPVLKGRDAERLRKDVERKPDKKEIEKLVYLTDVVRDIRKK